MRIWITKRCYIEKKKMFVAANMVTLFCSYASFFRLHPIRGAEKNLHNIVNKYS